jgi:hypothetical protein
MTNFMNAPGVIARTAAETPQQKEWIARANRILWRCRLTDDGCWAWTGARNDKGYGRVRIERRIRLPHRVVAYACGIVDGLEVASDDDHVLHQCDNGLCCNPKHMKAGTLSENMQECVARGRHRR